MVSRILNALLILPVLCVFQFAIAAPSMNTLFVQGYLRKASGSAVTDGSYTMSFSIRSGSTYFWTKSYSVSVSGGYFSQSLSGASASPYSGSIDSSTIANAATGAMIVNIQSTVDGLPVSFDIQATPVSLALLADKSISVVAGAIDNTALGASAVTGAKIATGTIQDSHLVSSGTLPAWDGSALINLSAANLSGTLPSASFPATLPAVSGANLTVINGSKITTGTIPSSVLPTTISNATTFSATGTALTVTNNASVGGTLGVTGTTTLAALTGTGTTTINGTGSSTTTLGGGTSTGTISIGASTGAQAVSIGGSTGTGNITVGNTGAASATVIQSGSTGKIKIGSSGVAVTSMGACTIASFTAVSGANAKTCTSLPTGAAVSCSPSASQGATVVWSSFASSAGNVTITMSGAGAAATWYCMWVVP